MIAELSDRLIGVEIEVAVPIVGTGATSDVQTLMARILKNHGIPSHVRPYNRTPIPQGCDLAIECDSSIQGEQRYAGMSWSQIEIKTRPMNYADLQRVLPPALDIIRYLGARSTPSCGLHVHHNLPEAASHPKIVRNLQHLWWRYHKVIYGLVAPSRHSNTYCRPPQQNDAVRFDACHNFEQLRHKLDGCDRYSGLNLTNLTDVNRRTVEWRVHNGTTDWNKIGSWVLATQRWTVHAIHRSCQYRPEPVANSQAGLNSLLITTGLKPNNRVYQKVDKELRQAGRFLLRRWKHFNQQA